MKTIVEKPWGCEEILELNQDYVLKRITLKEGHSCSLQYHKKKRETIFIIQGSIQLKKGNRIIAMPVGSCSTIEPFEVHRMTGKGKVDSAYLEVSTPELDDVVRLNDDYGRV